MFGNADLSLVYVFTGLFGRTLLKQGPYGLRPVVKKVVVVTPGSLVKVKGGCRNGCVGGEGERLF